MTAPATTAAAGTTTAELDASLRGARVPLEEIPVIDFGPFFGPHDQRKEVALAVGRACRDIGFFYLVNHGVAQSLVDAAFAESRRFFALPKARKQEIAIEKSSCHRGYFAVGGENLDPRKQTEGGDFKEGLK